MLKLPDVSEVRTASIIRAVMTLIALMTGLHGATSQKTKLHTRRRENLKSHIIIVVS
jgi:hypothetical protein